MLKSLYRTPIQPNVIKNVIIKLQTPEKNYSKADRFKLLKDVQLRIVDGVDTQNGIVVDLGDRKSLIQII